MNSIELLDRGRDVNNGSQGRCVNTGICLLADSEIFPSLFQISTINKFIPLLLLSIHHFSTSLQATGLTFVSPPQTSHLAWIVTCQTTIRADFCFPNWPFCRCSPSPCFYRPSSPSSSPPPPASIPPRMSHLHPTPPQPYLANHSLTTPPSSPPSPRLSTAMSLPAKHGSSPAVRMTSARGT